MNEIPRLLRGKIQFLLLALGTLVVASCGPEVDCMDVVAYEVTNVDSRVCYDSTKPVRAGGTCHPRMEGANNPIVCWMTVDRTLVIPDGTRYPSLETQVGSGDWANWTDCEFTSGDPPRITRGVGACDPG